MTNINTASKICLSLINKSIDNTIIWSRISSLKEYLKNKESSIRDIAYLNTYLDFLQRLKFVFDCEETYVTVDNNCVYILAKNKYSMSYRIDCLDINDVSDSQWRPFSVSLPLILRLRNAAYVSSVLNPHIEDSTFMNTISQSTSDQYPRHHCTFVLT